MWKVVPSVNLWVHTQGFIWNLPFIPALSGATLGGNFVFPTVSGVPTFQIFLPTIPWGILSCNLGRGTQWESAGWGCQAGSNFRDLPSPWHPYSTALDGAVKTQRQREKLNLDALGALGI